MIDWVKKLFIKSPVKSITQEADTYSETLKMIHKILFKYNHAAQADVISVLLLHLENKQYKLFAEKLKSVDVWGGSGAVWEVAFENAFDERQFQLAIIKLIDSMNATGVSSARINRIKTLFAEDIART